METRYINQSRYKRVARSERKKRTVARNKKKTVTNVPIANNRLPKYDKKKNKRRIRIIKKIWRVVFCMILVFAIAAISRLILKDESSPFIPNIFEKKVVNDNILNIGIIEKDLSEKYVDNVVIKELDSYAYPMLLKVGTDYQIDYILLDSVDKISNSEYILNVNENFGITANQIKEQLEEYLDRKNMYYPMVKNISSIEVKSKNSINITLKEDDEYFAYNLNLPVYVSNALQNLNYSLVSKEKEEMVYERRETADSTLISKIIVKKVSSLDNAVDEYKKGNIDMFFSNSNRVTQLLGRYEYNITSYRDGNMLFLLGNSESQVFSKGEIRNAICYGIDRDAMLKDIFQYNVRNVDLPYIYDETKYKYDYIAAENLLLSNGYYKKKSVYMKREQGSLVEASLKLLVNKGDKENIKVANYIKKDLMKIGIEINIQQLSSNKIKDRIADKRYDLVLADVTINNNPNIKFLQKYLCASENINRISEQIKDPSSLNLEEINEFRDALSKEFCYMGIKANNIYVVYSKKFSYISDVSYMNIFSRILNVSDAKK